MPLKHVTETLLVVVLGAAVLLTGFVLSTLPPVQEGIGPWVGLAIAAAAYPLVLYPFLRKHRADYWFRVLHMAPFALCLLWLLLQVAAGALPSMAPLMRWFVWGFTSPGVLIVFVLLAAFCLHVIRRRVPRLSLLAVLFVPFLAAGILSEQSPQWHRSLSASIWGGAQPVAVRPVGASSSSAAPIAKSDDPKEEAWREKLRAVQNRSAGSSTAASRAARAASSLSSVARSAHSSSGRTIIAEKPGRLPTSGAGIELLSGFFLAGFCGAVHRRAKRRATM